MAGLLNKLTVADGIEPPGLPPFASVLKSREVEDPVNLWLHRPLAYGFVSLIYRSSITPNQVTFMAMAVGVAAAACWFVGSPAVMVAGGVLLWLSAILDGADGILARVKRMSSPAGRALDGLADLVVGVSSSAAALYHIATQGQLALWVVLVAGLAAVGSTVLQLNLYDLYKELFLRSTRLTGGESHSAGDIDEVKRSGSIEQAPWHIRFAMDCYAGYLHKQERITQLTNPFGYRLLGHPFAASEESARLYRTHNKAAMRLWIGVSLAPHSYLFAIAGMLDLLAPYLIARLTVMNLAALLALFLQRRASRATLHDYQARGLLPDQP